MKKLNIKRFVFLVLMACLPFICLSQTPDAEAKESIVTASTFKDIFNGRGLVETSVNAAKAGNYTFVFVGSIVGNAGTNRYMFTDESGKGVVEIADFGGLEVGPADKVRLTGIPGYDNGLLYLEVNEIILEN